MEGDKKYHRYKRKCDLCNKDYEGYGRKFCSRTCLNILNILNGHYERLASLKRGKPSFFRGGKLTEEQKQKISRAHKGRKVKKEIIEQQKRTMKRLYAEGKIKVWNKGLTKEIDNRLINSSLRMKEYNQKIWNDPKIKLERVKIAIQNTLVRPTSYEKKISELCIENNLPFIYTGDGTFLIGHKNPDFVDKEKKIAIEVYHEYFKIRDFGSCEEYERQRSEYFSKYGYKTIFIRTKEIEDTNWKYLCMEKIINVMGGKNYAK